MATLTDSVPFWFLFKAYYLDFCRVVFPSAPFFDHSNIILTSILSCGRKTFLQIGCKGNHLQGVGGPGAPHVFSFDRVGDLGSAVSKTSPRVTFKFFRGEVLGCGILQASRGIRSILDFGMAWAHRRIHLM